MPHWDDDALRDEVTRVLQGLLRCNTTNPPGNEILAITFLAGLLKQAGLETTILESAPARANLVSVLRGDGSLRPFLLMGHVDVVPAEADLWEHPPFAAELHNGFIYGRGARDMKNTVAVELMVVLLLQRNRVPLKRDVIFMANADEEAGGTNGAKWMMQNHPDLIRAEYALNEGGGAQLPVNGRKFILCQTGEKGNSRFVVRTHGTPGHGSEPHPDNAILHLADALTRLGEAHLPIHVTDTARAFVEAIAAELGADGEQWLGLLDESSFWHTLESLNVGDGVKRRLVATFTNTVVPTILKAGGKTNVIPSVAEAYVDSRKLPGATNASFLKELRTVLPAWAEIEFTGDTPGIESMPDSPLFEKIKLVMKRYVPDGVVVPALVVGGTDARHQTKLGTLVYGFSPSNADPSESERVHGHNERVHVDDLLFGVKAMYDIVSEFCAE
ncbi:MAG: M20/M25/M40 family metallo-hydrolase [Chloroflexi bacterium]|nr:MAG: M20/M25/M40 family metallo-hydrolase [Chloroflexota bacterium]